MSGTAIHGTRAVLAELERTGKPQSAWTPVGTVTVDRNYGRLTLRGAPRACAWVRERIERPGTQLPLWGAVE